MTFNISCPNRRYTYICDVLNVVVCGCGGGIIKLLYIWNVWVLWIYICIYGSVFDKMSLRYIFLKL